MPDGTAKVVVVEDDASMRQALERILNAAGYAAVTFGSAEAALEAGAACTADCLILDVRLPGLSGFDLYRRVTGSGRRVPAVFVTAHDETAVREVAESMGAAGYLPKPFSGRTLLGAVERALRGP